MPIPETKVRHLLGNAVGGSNPPILIAGPCVIESRTVLDETAAYLVECARTCRLAAVFKSSFDKANRSSVRSYRGPGLEKGLAMLADIRSQYGLPVLTDVHDTEQIEPAAEVADILQIPAFLCRQTDLICKAARTGRIINVKKGQFIAPGDVDKIVQKIQSEGNDHILITERGYTFGYRNLIVDPRSFHIIRSMDILLVFDATHSVQMPGGGEVSGGNRDMIAVQARSAVAAGVDGLFFEIHPQPEKALSDASNMLPMEQLEPLLSELLRIDAVVKDR